MGYRDEANGIIEFKHVIGLSFWLSLVGVLFFGWLFIGSGGGPVDGLDRSVFLFPLVMSLFSTTGFAAGWLMLFDQNKL